MKNRYGVTPWGSWFIDVLDGYKMGERLNRGRRYANSGRVLSLNLTEGKAAAKVEGNYSPFYKVEISFPPLAEAEQVYKLIEEDPPLLARIAAGELPEAFLEKLKKKGINLIPRRWREMKRSCTCPDYGDPCKHMAALYYIIAREIDSDPHILFRLRGMDLAERFGNEAVRQITPPFTVTFEVKENIPQGKTAQIPAPVELEAVPHCGELISSLLPSAPPFCDRDFAQVMAEFYHYCASYQGWEKAEQDEERLAEIEHDFSRSHWTAVCPAPEPGVEIYLQAQNIDGRKRCFNPVEAFDFFVQFSKEDGTASYTFLFYLFKFLNLVCSAGAFIPFVSAENETLKIIWRPFETVPPVPAMLKAIASHEPGMFAIKTGRKKEQIVSGQSAVDLLCSAFLNEWVRRNFLLVRGNLNKQGTDEEYRELLNLFFQGFCIDVSSPAQRSLPAAVDRWLSALHIDFSAYQYVITVKESRTAKKSDDNAHNAALQFFLSMDVIIEHDDGIKKIPVGQCKDLEMLRAPVALSNYLPELKDLMSAKKTGGLQVRLGEERLVSFLDSASGLLARLGIKVNLPKSLARELKPRLVIKGNSAGKSLKTYLDLNTLQEFEWRIAIGEEVITLKEFEKLVKQKSALVRFKDGFVKMNPKEFSRLLKKSKDTPVGINDFLKAHFSGDSILAFDARETIDNIFRDQNFPIPTALKAKLRPYQKRGYNWICSLLFSGFGCILADDMGLGKTVQSIAALLRLKEEKLLKNGCLVVAPAALLANWEKELARFSPSLNVSRYHGNRRVLDRKQDVFLTTYQTAVRDTEKLKNEAFSLLVVDEAHLMKNAETRISRTIKQLRSQYRLALSGTPVENRLEDLRSLFDFILPGYLGNAAQFREQYRIPIEVM
jgi:uncharacterized Zn finger protein